MLRTTISDTASSWVAMLHSNADVYWNVIVTLKMAVPWFVQDFCVLLGNYVLMNWIRENVSVFSNLRTKIVDKQVANWVLPAPLSFLRKFNYLQTRKVNVEMSQSDWEISSKENARLWSSIMRTSDVHEMDVSYPLSSGKKGIRVFFKKILIWNELTMSGSETLLYTPLSQVSPQTHRDICPVTQYNPGNVPFTTFKSLKEVWVET